MDKGPKVRKPFALYCDDPSLTKQSFKDDCDIHKILERVRAGGDVSHLNSRVAQYGDFSNVPDYQSALDLVNRANGMFMSLDARIRERFANDPAKMLSFLQDPKNREEALRLGIIEEPAVPAGGPGGVPPVESKPSASGGKSDKAEKARRLKWIEIEAEGEEGEPTGEPGGPKK